MAISPGHIAGLPPSDLEEMISIEKRIDNYLVSNYRVGTKIYVYRSSLGPNDTVVNMVIGNYRRSGWEVLERQATDPVLVFSYAYENRE